MMVLAKGVRRMSTGFAIRELRRKAGISVAEIAKALEISKTAVWNWDRGKSFPRQEFVPLLATLLKVDPSMLVRPPDGRRSIANVEDDVLTVREILADTRVRLARKLGLPQGQIKLTLTIEA